jgi:hypothetical protein
VTCNTLQYRSEPTANFVEDPPVAVLDQTVQHLAKVGAGMSLIGPTRTKDRGKPSAGPLAPADLPAEQNIGAAVSAAAKQLPLSARGTRSVPLRCVARNEPHVGHLMCQAFHNWICKSRVRPVRTRAERSEARGTKRCWAHSPQRSVLGPFLCESGSEIVSDRRGWSMPMRSLPPAGPRGSISPGAFGTRRLCWSRRAYRVKRGKGPASALAYVPCHRQAAKLSAGIRP